MSNARSVHRLERKDHYFDCEAERLFSQAAHVEIV